MIIRHVAETQLYQEARPAPPSSSPLKSSAHVHNYEDKDDDEDYDASMMGQEEKGYDFRKKRYSVTSSVHK